MWIEGQEIIFDVECIQAQSPLIFELWFETLFDLKNPVIKKDSVGIFNLTFKKNEERIWREIIKDENIRKTLKPKIWYQIESLHPEDMKTFYRL